MGLLLIFVLLFNSPVSNSTLTIQIQGIEEIKGKIQIGIFNNAAKFPDEGGEYRIEFIKVNSKDVTYKITDLPYGDYAIALFHDVNGDGTCNLNFLGIPKEPYGFSNNVKPVVSAPSFSSAKISVHKDIAISISLIH